MDRIKEMLDQLNELGDEQIAELKNAIVSEFETVEKEDPTPQTVDAMTSLADMLDTVRAEVKRREAAAEELTTRAAEAASRIQAGQEDVVKEDAPAEGSPEEEAKETPDEEAKEPTADDETPAAPPAPAPMAKKPMGAASTVTEEGSELSTETTEATTEVVATEEVTAPAELSSEEVTEVAEVTEATEAAPAAEEAAAPEVEAPADAVAEAAVAEVVTEVAAEASTQETTIAQEEQKEQEATVTAAASNEGASFEAPADRRPVTETSVATVAITAGADIPGYTAGSEMKNMSDVAEAFSKRLHGLRRVNGGDGEQHIVASLHTSFPEERTLTQDAESNWAKIQALTSPEAITASGGHVAPYEVRYDIFGIGSTSRPVRDSLAKFAADRGGIRFVTPPVLSSYDSAVGVWTNATDITPNSSTKTSLTVAAAAEQTVATDAVTLQMQFGNLASRAYPELISRHNELGLIQHAREAEQNLLSQIGTASTAVTTTSLIGFGRDFLVQIGRAAAAYRSRHRMAPDAPLRAIVPAWVKDAMAADLALSMPGDSNLNAYSEIEGYVAARGVNLTASLDATVFGAQSSGALNEFADSFVWYLFAEGSFLFLDGGTLDVGIIRDSTLVGTNDYKMFVETFEGIAFVGVESLKITSSISVNGAAAALRDTTGGATAAAIEY